MEMNTRLQVEHPVTEMVTGLDLVEWQFRVAAGQALPLAQDEIRFRGCAMEARLYAEDPDAGFLPSPGRIHRLQLPSGEGLRVDAGVEAGDGVSGAYDPMIAKIIAFAPSRAQALARLAAALRQSVVIGPKTNLNFLLALAKAPAFRDGAYHTQLIDDGLQGLVAPQDSGDRRAILAAAMAICAREWDSRPDAGLDPWSTADSFELTGLRQRRIDLMVDGRRVEFALHADGGELSLRLGDAAMAIGAATPGDVSLHATPEAAFAFANGRQHRVAALDFAMLGGAGQGEAAGRVEAPMPGRLIAVLAREGEAVERGARLAILEAMKMEHTIIAPRAGMVARIQAAIGAQVAQGDVLMLVEAAGDPQN